MPRVLNKIGYSDRFGSIRKIDKNLAFDAYCNGSEIILVRNGRNVDQSDSQSDVVSKKKFLIQGISIRFKSIVESLGNGLSFFIKEREYASYIRNKQLTEEVCAKYRARV